MVKRNNRNKQNLPQKEMGGFDLELRPHHVLGYVGHELQPEFYYLPNQEYISYFRQYKGGFHSDELILYWRDIIKKLHENPSLKFKYVQSIDSVCEKCEHSKKCDDPNHEYYKIDKKEDDKAVELFPELEFGKIYDGHYLRKLFEKKG